MAYKGLNKLCQEGGGPESLLTVSPKFSAYICSIVHPIALLILIAKEDDSNATCVGPLQWTPESQNSDCGWLILALSTSKVMFCDSLSADSSCHCQVQLVHVICIRKQTPRHRV